MKNPLGVRLAQLPRLPVDALLRTCVAWEPQRERTEGYSIALACVASLAPLAVANLRFCARSSGNRLYELIAVFDCPPEKIPACVVETVRELSPSIKVTLLGYGVHQNRVARLFKSGWVYAWMSWCLAIAHARTRAVIIHDLDAIPISPTLFEQIYENWLEAQAEFCGIRFRSGSDLTTSMGLVTTYELALDADYVRRTFRPVDLFNKLTRLDGRVISLDTMLYAQSRSPRRVVRPIDETQLVHPSQLICQYNYLINGQSKLRNLCHSLPMLPYFLYLGNSATCLTTVGAQTQG